MMENSHPDRLTIITFFLVTIFCCSASQAASSETLIRNAALLITMDSSIGASDLGVRVGRRADRKRQDCGGRPISGRCRRASHRRYRHDRDAGLNRYA